MTAGFGEDQVDLATLALDIADEAARGSIESYCRHVSSGDKTWYDLDTVELANWAHVDRAATYLQRRRGDAAAGSRMARSKAFPHLVRFD